jgi:plastocyanin
MKHTACALVGLLCAATVQAATLQVTVSDDKGRPVPQAVVFLESPEAARAARPLASVEMAQKDKSFVPETLVVTRGTSVQFPNRDTVRHHVYSFSPAKRFELKLYIGTPASPVVFDQAGVVVLGCNIHDEMIGWIAVVDTPHFGSTGANGQVQLRDVPEGNYRLRVWHSGMAVGAPALDLPQRLGAAGAAASVVLKGLTP